MSNNSSNFEEVNGIKFWRDTKGYWLGQVEGRPKRLHVYVWELHNGPVPDGYDIHHIDHNKDNNSIENLAAVQRSEHHKQHGLDLDKDLCRYNLDKARPKAAEWHKSESGREWHKAQYDRSLREKWDEMVSKPCEVCGKMFECSVLVAHKTRFCSNNCKSQFRRDSGLDNIAVSCQICGREFETNKYSRGKFCSPECRKENRLRRKRERAVKDIVTDR